MTHALYQYAYLQVLDFLTTVAFLLHGIQEANPVVRWAVAASPTPLMGLLVVKMLAIMLGLSCWYFGRARLLTKVNLVFAMVVAWNLIALIMGGV